MVLVTIGNEVYKPTNITEGYHPAWDFTGFWAMELVKTSYIVAMDYFIGIV